MKERRSAQLKEKTLWAKKKSPCAAPGERGTLPQGKRGGSLTRGSFKTISKREGGVFLRQVPVSGKWVFQKREGRFTVRLQKKAFSVVVGRAFVKRAGEDGGGEGLLDCKEERGPRLPRPRFGGGSRKKKGESPSIEGGDPPPRRKRGEGNSLRALLPY